MFIVGAKAPATHAVVNKRTMEIEMERVMPGSRLERRLERRLAGLQQQMKGL